MWAFLNKLINDSSINMGDGAAGGITVAAFFELLPHVSALLGAIWIALRIYVTIRDDVLGGKKNGNK